ncbi:LPD3 domain-containing protein [Bacteroides uniformis]|uniref:LPD3 domain-containing protein n=1 Tax=Bacteroides uniformis TaxID=820 RepID=UPI0035690040
MNETYNRWYLKTEYNFALSSAAMAARWKQWWDDEDRDRYLLQYRTVGDKRVREAHRALHNVTLPITSNFWDEYFPPNGWNCRCTVMRVRRGKYLESDEHQAMLAGSQATAGKHQEMMRFNPGKQMACFPFYNPYTISRCKDCPDRPGTLKLAKMPDNELCAACKVIREMTRRKDELKKLRTEIREKAQFLKDKVLKNEQFGKDIRVSGTNIKEWLNQPHKWIVEKNRMLLDIENVIAEAPYLGNGPDKHDPDITMHLFETTLHNEKSWIIVRELIDGSVKLHSISDSEDILQYITKRRE